MKSNVNKKPLINIFIIFTIVAIISLSTQSYASISNVSAGEYKINGVTLVPANSINVSKFKSSGFNTVFLNVDNIRSIKKPYNTNYRALKQLYANVQALEKANMKYVLCFTSGPGYSVTSKVSTIFTNKAELRYYTQMVNEVLGRYKNNKNLAGASIDFSSPNVEYKKYYEVQNFIIGKSQANYKKLPFIYNLHILTYEENLATMPIPKLPNLIINLPISLNALNYPGYGAGQKVSCTLDKKTLLSTLEKLDSYSNKYDIKTILSVKTPWVKNSEVMLQDIFELLKMIKLDYNLSYGNSNDRYDFSTNNSVVKVIGRFNN